MLSIEEIIRNLIKMSSLKLLPLIASVGLVLASCASLVTGADEPLARELPHTPAKLSQLGDIRHQYWVQKIRDKYLTAVPDKAFELLERLDKMYESLGAADSNDDEVQISGRDRQQIALELIDEANQSSSGGQFCTKNNMKVLNTLIAYHFIFMLDNTNPLVRDNPEDKYHESARRYFQKRASNFASLCKSYIMDNLNKRVGALSGTKYEADMRLLGDKLIVLAQQGDTLFKLWSNSRKFSAKWTDTLLAFLKEKSGNNLNPKCYLTGTEGRARFSKLWTESVVDMCRRYEDATSEARYYRQADGVTKEQDRWLYYGDFCFDLVRYREELAKALYRELRSKSYTFPWFQTAMNKGFNKLAC